MLQMWTGWTYCSEVPWRKPRTGSSSTSSSSSGPRSPNHSGEGEPLDNVPGGVRGMRDNGEPIDERKDTDNDIYIDHSETDTEPSNPRRFCTTPTINGWEPLWMLHCDGPGRGQ